MFAKFVVVLCAVYVPFTCSAQGNQCFPHTTKIVRYYNLYISEDCGACLRVLVPRNLCFSGCWHIFFSSVLRNQANAFPELHFWMIEMGHS